MEECFAREKVSLSRERKVNKDIECINTIAGGHEIEIKDARTFMTLLAAHSPGRGTLHARLRWNGCDHMVDVGADLTVWIGA